MLDLKHYFTTRYYPQPNGEVAKFNSTLVEQMHHYIAEHQLEWPDFFHPLNYAYNLQVNRSMGGTPFELVLPQHLSGILVQAGTAKRRATGTYLPFR